MIACVIFARVEESVAMTPLVAARLVEVAFCASKLVLVAYAKVDGVVVEVPLNATAVVGVEVDVVAGGVTPHVVSVGRHDGLSVAPGE